jgi:hypothetical protein
MRRVLISACVAAAIAMIASMPISGQSNTPPLVITAYNGGPAIAYTTPKTPWGDPDLQGVWSSDDASMPMSRPANVNGRLYLNDDEYAARQKQIENGVKNAENAVGSFRGDFPRRAFRQTSLIVDPPDGRQPQPTAEAQKRRAPRDQGTFGNGPFDSWLDFTLYDRCITRGIVGSVLRGQRSVSISATRAPIGKATCSSSKRPTSPTRPASGPTATDCATAIR